MDLAQQPAVTYKPFWQSKTMWTALIFAIIPAFPPAAVWVAANPVWASSIVSGVFAVLRLVTKGQVTIN